MSWVQIVFSALSALIGGFCGGCIVAYRIGRWRGQIEERLAIAEKRLEKGDPLVDAVPVIQAREEMILAEIREIKGTLNEMRGAYVSHEECDRRHKDGG